MKYYVDKEFKGVHGDFYSYELEAYEFYDTIEEAQAECDLCNATMPLLENERYVVCETPSEEE